MRKWVKIFREKKGKKVEDLKKNSCKSHQSFSRKSKKVENQVKFFQIFLSFLFSHLKSLGVITRTIFFVKNMSLLF